METLRHGENFWHIAVLNREAEHDGLNAREKRSPARIRAFAPAPISDIEYPAAPEPGFAGVPPAADLPNHRQAAAFPVPSAVAPALSG